MAKTLAFDAACGLQRGIGQPGPGFGQIGALFKAGLGFANAGQAPVAVTGMDDEQEVICPRLEDRAAKGHALRQFQHP